MLKKKKLGPFHQDIRMLTSVKRVSLLDTYDKAVDTRDIFNGVTTSTQTHGQTYQFTIGQTTPRGGKHTLFAVDEETLAKH